MTVRMIPSASALLASGAFVLGACAGGATPAPPASASPKISTPETNDLENGATQVRPAENGAAETSDQARSAPLATEACGQFTCLRFASPADALRHLVEVDAPRVLGFGESHARAGTEHIASATSRFAAELLPVLAPASSGLVVELLAPPEGCNPAATAQVEKEERQITSGQSQSNQNEFVALGHRAKDLGVVPYILRASCEDLDAVAAAGDEGVLVLMETIARLTTAEVERLLAQAPDTSRRRVLAYGGALHNDTSPRAGRETWSYGPHLLEATGGSYTAVDLIVPEHIQDTPSWRALSWYEAAPPAKPDSAVLLEVAPRSWVLFFPASVAAQPPGHEPAPPVPAPSSRSDQPAH